MSLRPQQILPYRNSVDIDVPMKNFNFAIKNPELVKEWHPTKNGKLAPYDVSAYAHDVVWWKCPKGDDHQWQAMISNRSQGKGCSICAGRKVVKSKYFDTPALTIP